MKLAGMAEETLEIVDRGTYVGPSGHPVDIADAVARAVAETALYRPAELRRLAGVPGPARHDTVVEVTREGTGEAGLRLWAEGERDVVALNFASARRVGGGFLGGARAQEEELCRASALYRCLETQADYYEANRAHPDALYTDHIVYSPRVPFFRDAGRALLDAPFTMSVITAPAPNTGAALEQDPESGPRIRDTFFRRAAMLLAVARDRGHDCVLLGAWGCGAFRGDPDVAAGAFEQALSGTFAGAFRRVVFAVLVARSADQHNYDVFSRLARG